jgi:uncharacterized RDD family membrane protein YckC
MRCPKCSYLSYEEVARCRNCGYDFALAAPPADPAQPPALDAPDELRSWRGPTSRTPSGPTDLTVPDEEGASVDLPLFEAPPHTEPPPRTEPRHRPEPPTRDAPPMPIPPVAPPLVVRRKVDVPRAGASASTHRGTEGRRDVSPPALDFDGPAAVSLGDDVDTPHEGTPWVGDDRAETDDASGGHGSAVQGRVTAGLVDAAILLGIDALVVWLTLRLLGLSPGDWTRLPLAPLLGFLFLLDTSYLVTFTAASGQTIGKSLAGLRVVSLAGGRVPFGHAVVRSAVVLLCAAPAGLGLLPIFLDASGRGLHDRIAGTRVIETS